MSSGAKIAAVFFAGLLLAAFAFVLRGALLPFILAAILAYVTSPMVAFFELRGVKRVTAAAIVYTALTALLGILFYTIWVLVWDELPRLKAEFPYYFVQMKTSAYHLQESAAARWPWLLQQRDVVHELIVSSGRWIQHALQQAPDYLSGLANIVLYFFLVPFVGFYLLAGGPGFFRRVLDACPGRWVEKFLSLFYEIDEVLGNYLRAIFFEAFLVGTLATMGLFFLGLDQAVLIGVVAGMGNLIPYFGPILGGLAGMAAAFFQFQNVLAPIQVALLFSAIKFCDDWFFQPYIMKRSVELHPVAVIFAVMCGGHLGGLWGLLFAVPIACILKEILKIISVWYMAEVRLRQLPAELQELSARPWIV